MSGLSEIITLKRGDALICHILMSLEHPNLLSGLVVLISEGKVLITTKVFDSPCKYNARSLQDLNEYLYQHNIVCSLVDSEIYHGDYQQILVKPNRSWKYKINQVIRRKTIYDFPTNPGKVKYASYLIK